jgi:predicted ABC-type transport system involved in lysophospholipase L1 biosynthesis ATPase subunit
MLDLNRSAGASLIIVTHDRELARKAGRILRLEDGRLVEEQASFRSVLDGDGLKAAP